MDKKKIFAVSVGILALVTGILAVRIIWFSPGQIVSEAPSPETDDAPVKTSRLSGPYTHKNLAIYLIHGSDVREGRTPLTLEEGLEQKVVLVHETENVSELAIENVSLKDEIFVQAGDIVKGGMQDRVLTVDLIVPARSGRLPIDSFCVERGRWTPRGTEPAHMFESSADYVSSKGVKMAAMVNRSQERVWSEVDDVQSKLSAATNTDARSDISRTSLPLTLKKPQVRVETAPYVKALTAIVDDRPDAIGFLFVINGKINSADIYGSNALFLKLWPKLLKASAVEAVADSSDEAPKDLPGLLEISDFLETSENAAVEKRRTVTDRIELLTRVTAKSVFLESLDRGVLLHGSYIAK